MNNLKEKLKKQGGFTLMEMLIVVAIIAILIAVSIPFLNNALEKARQATDAANERSAKAEIIACYMLDATYNGTDKVKADGSTEYAYDAAKGKLVNDTPDAYGKCDGHKGGHIKVSITADGEVTVTWYKGTAKVDSTSTPLCSTTLANK